MAEATDTVLGLTAQIVSAHVAKNAVEPDKLPDLIREVYRTLASIGEEPVESAKPKAAVPPTKSVFADYIVCLEDGKKMKMLKRHLMTDHKLTPDQYRARWGLPPPIRWWRRIMPRPVPRWPRRSVLGRNDPMPRKAGRKRAVKA